MEETGTGEAGGGGTLDARRRCVRLTADNSTPEVAHASQNQTQRCGSREGGGYKSQPDARRYGGSAQATTNVRRQRAFGRPQCMSGARAAKLALHVPISSRRRALDGSLLYPADERRMRLSSSPLFDRDDAPVSRCQVRADPAICPRLVSA